MKTKSGCSLSWISEIGESLKVAKENEAVTVGVATIGEESLYLLRHELILHDGVNGTSRW